MFPKLPLRSLFRVLRVPTSPGMPVCAAQKTNRLGLEALGEGEWQEFRGEGPQWEEWGSGPLLISCCYKQS